MAPQPCSQTRPKVWSLRPADHALGMGQAATLEQGGSVTAGVYQTRPQGLPMLLPS